MTNGFFGPSPIVELETSLPIARMLNAHFSARAESDTSDKFPDCLSYVCKNCRTVDSTTHFHNRFA